MPRTKNLHTTRVDITSQMKLDTLNDFDNKVSNIAAVCQKYNVPNNDFDNKVSNIAAVCQKYDVHHNAVSR